MSDYPPRPRREQPSGWPAQPPQYTQQPPFGQQPYGQQPNGQQPFEQQPGGYGLVRPPRRRRRRGLIALVTSLVILVVLAVVADFAAKAYAENQIASQIQTSAKLQGKPAVSIEGFPFLTQVAAHDLKAIDISASNVGAGKFTISSIKARATGVRPSSSFNSATIDQINGSALITFASLENALGLQGIATISADPQAGPNAVQISADILGSVSGQVQVTGPNQVTLRMGSLSGLGSLLAGALPAQTQVIDIPKLPAGLTVRSVMVTSQGVVATASAQHTTLSQ